MLRSLTPESFKLDGKHPAVTVEAAYSKRRQEDVQPIRRDLADSLKPWLATKKPGEPVLPLPDKTARMIQGDLKRAEIAAEDRSGRILDFHALRHTYISRVVMSGVSVKVAQELARHATPTLTIGRYAHVRLHDLTEALEALEPSAPDAEAQREEASPAAGLRLEKDAA